MNVCSKIVAVALMAATAPWVAAPAGRHADLVAGPSLRTRRRRRSKPCVIIGHGGWYGGGAGAGFAAGALIGGAIAGSRGYGYGAYGYAPYGYSGYAPGYYDDGYVAVAPGGGGDGYCMQRYRSYDPASGTFLGYDGLRHPCP